MVLAAPGERIGSATLVLANPDGGLLRVPLPRIRAGFDEVNPRRLLGRQIVPGLAVDETAGRAYVVAANEPLVAEVDLANGAVTYRERARGGGAARSGAGGRQGNRLRRLPDGALGRRRHDRGGGRGDPHAPRIGGARREGGCRSREPIRTGCG